MLHKRAHMNSQLLHDDLVIRTMSTKRLSRTSSTRSDLKLPELTSPLSSMSILYGSAASLAAVAAAAALAAAAVAAVVRAGLLLANALLLLPSVLLTCVASV
jgi:hypothetical protein